MEQKSRIVFWIVIAIGVVAVVLLLVKGDSLLRSGISTPDVYQAVFLDNAQVYFGKLKSRRDDFFSLTSVFYLRAGTVQKGETVAPGTQIDLIKLGSELHQPKDEMIIGKSHVLFYEDMNEGSDIMKIIRRYLAAHK